MKWRTDGFDKLKELHTRQKNWDAVAGVDVVHVAASHADSIKHDHQARARLHDSQFRSIQVEPKEAVLELELCRTQLCTGWLARPKRALSLESRVVVIIKSLSFPNELE